MATNGTSPAPKHTRNPKPPKLPKASKAAGTAATTTSAAISVAHPVTTGTTTNSTPNNKNANNDGKTSSKPDTPAKGRNKRTSDVLSLFTEKEMSAGQTIKLRPPPGGNAKKKPRQSGGWKVSAEELEKQDEAYLKALQNSSNGTVGGKSPGPIVTQLDEKDLTTLSSTRALTDDPDHVVCKHCKKPVIKSAAVQHIKACLRAKTEKAKERKKAKLAAESAAAAAAKGGGGAGEGGGEGQNGTAAGKGGEGDDNGKEESATGGGSGSGGGKSVPADGADGAEGKGGIVKKGAKKMAAKKATGEPKKTKKQKALEEKLAKEPKQKKKKEKPAKAEPKPKAPVDVEKQCGVPLPNGLLCARSLTCKSHSMGAKRAVMGRSQPYDVLLQAYQRKNQAKQQKAAINASGPHPEEADGPLGPVDSDEETELVMAAVSRACPVPLVSQTLVPVRKKYNYIRMRDMLANALRQPGMGGLFGGGAGSNGGGGSTGVGVVMGDNMALGDMSGPLMEAAGGGVASGTGGGAGGEEGDIVMGGMEPPPTPANAQPMMRNESSRGSSQQPQRKMSVTA